MKNVFGILTLIVFAFVIGCAGAPEVKKEPQPQPDLSMISSQNEQLANHPIGGFAYKSSKLNTANWDSWAKSAAPIVKEIVTKLPDGYALQVTGHADASGPEEPVGDKPGNIKISTDRAQTVFDALKRAGISSPKITYKGTGSDELLPQFDPRAAEQRRVTFKIVPVK